MKKKGLLGIIVLACLTLVAGTFAWTSYNQRALNENKGSRGAGGIAKGRMHDDYQKSGNKDVYAENYGPEDLIVRVRLSEYFEQNGTPLVAGTKKDDFKTWTPYRLPETTAQTKEYRNFVKWTLGGSKVYVPTFNTSVDSEAVDVSGDGIDRETYTTNTHVGTGSHTDFTVGQVVSNPNLATDKRTAKNTQTQKNAPITMAAWKALAPAAKKGDFWVIDTDGWAYWANPLKPNTATSLLLDKIEMQAAKLAPIDRWYYGIDVNGQFATFDDTKDFGSNGGITADGQTLIDGLTGAKVLPDNVKPGDIFKFDSQDFLYLRALGGGNHLILRNEVLPNSGVINSNAYNGSDLDKAMKAYYEKLSVEAKKMVQPVQANFDSPYTFEGFSPDKLKFLGIDLDFAKVTPSGGERKAFALSTAEINSVSGPGTAFPTVESRKSSSAWWTRSSNKVGSSVSYLIEADGKTSYNDSHETMSARPALIINE